MPRAPGAPKRTTPRLGLAATASRRCALPPAPITLPAAPRRAARRRGQLEGRVRLGDAGGRHEHPLSDARRRQVRVGADGGAGTAVALPACLPGRAARPAAARQPVRDGSRGGATQRDQRAPLRVRVRRRALPRRTRPARPAHRLRAVPPARPAQLPRPAADEGRAGGEGRSDGDGRAGGDGRVGGDGRGDGSVRGDGSGRVDGDRRGDGRDGGGGRAGGDGRLGAAQQHPGAVRGARRAPRAAVRPAPRRRPADARPGGYRDADGGRVRRPQRRLPARRPRLHLPAGHPPRLTPPGPPALSARAYDAAGGRQSIRQRAVPAGSTRGGRPAPTPGVGGAAGRRRGPGAGGQQPARPAGRGGRGGGLGAVAASPTARGAPPTRHLPATRRPVTDTGASPRPTTYGHQRSDRYGGKAP